MSVKLQNHRGAKFLKISHHCPLILY